MSKTKTNNAPLVARFSNEPSLISEGQIDQFEANIVHIATDEKIQEVLHSEVAADEFWFASDDWRSRYRPYVVKDGILHIPVKGVLLHDFPWAFGGYATGYDYIWKAFERGLEDSEVRGIALVIHSPGGDVAGNFDMVDKMYERRGEKPVWAFASEAAYSAAYSIASVADKITVTRTGGVGSIGVVTMHIDYSKMLDQQGIKITLISAPKGGTKTERYPYVELSAEAEARIQDRVDYLYGIFVGSVARNRGMDEQAIRDTKALTFGATEAVSNGLADEIGSLEDALTAFSAELETIEGDEQMAEKTTADTAKTEEVRAAAFEEGKKEGMAAGRKEGAEAERERVSAILGSEEAKTRPASAMMMVELGIDAEKAATQLAKLPEEKPAAAAEGDGEEEASEQPKGKNKGKGTQAKSFENAMSEGNPDLGAEDDDDEKAEDDDLDVIANFGLGGFRKPEKRRA